MSLTDNTLILAACIDLILLSLVTPWLSPLFRIRKYCTPKQRAEDGGNDESEQAASDNDEATDLHGTTNCYTATTDTAGNESCPPLSVVVPIRRGTLHIDHYLELLLAQHYPDFRVIVIAEKGDGPTEDTLKLFAAHKNLYTTFVPDSSRYMSPGKLAVTLGVKAAKTEWIVLTDPTYLSTSAEWLRSMALHMCDPYRLVIGYTGYDDTARSYQRFERLWGASYALREAAAHTAYRSCGPNIAFRRSDFLTTGGYTGNLHLLGGEFDFIVNKLAQSRHTAIAVVHEARLRAAAPTGKQWHTEHVAYRACRRHFCHTTVPRLLAATDTAALHLTLLVTVGTGALAALTACWPLAATAAASLLLNTCLRIATARRAIKFFDENISAWRILPHELHIMWTSLAHALRLRHTDEQNFTTHKV